MIIRASDPEISVEPNPLADLPVYDVGPGQTMDDAFERAAAEGVDRFVVRQMVPRTPGDSTYTPDIIDADPDAVPWEAPIFPHFDWQDGSELPFGTSDGGVI